MEKLEKIQTILSALNDGVSKKDFEQAIKTILGLFQALEKRYREAIGSVESKQTETLNNINNDKSLFLSSFRQEAKDQLTKAIQDFTNKLITIDDKFGSLKEEIISETLSKVVIPPPEVKTESITQLRNLLTEIQTKDKELETKLNEIDGRVKAIPKRGGARKFQYTRTIRLTDYCDGATKTFTLPLDTVSVIGVFGAQFPINYDPYDSGSGDWSFAGRTLTLGARVSAPETGQTLYALVETLFYA